MNSGSNAIPVYLMLLAALAPSKIDGIDPSFEGVI